MNIDNLNKWLSLTANFGVLIGIIFLAIELQQNNELLQAEARYNRLESRKSSNQTILDNSNVVTAIIKSQEGEQLSPADVFLMQRLDMNTLLNIQYAYQEYQNGLLQESDLISENWKEQFISRESLRNQWNATKNTSFQPDFVEWMEINVVD